MKRLPAFPPGRDGIGLVEPADMRQLFGQTGQGRFALEVGVNNLRPRQGRERHDRPVHEPLVDDLEPLLDVGQLVAAGALWIDAVQDPGRHARDQDDPRGVDVAKLEHPLPVPLGHELERLLRGELEAGLLDVGVEVGRIDEAGAALVRAFRDGADDRLHTGLRFDRDDLPRLDVRTEVDGQIGEALEGVFVHRRQDSGSAIRDAALGSHAVRSTR
jgi:hypothetical protein